MSNIKKNKSYDRTLYFDLLRIFAVFPVIIQHTVDIHSNIGKVGWMINVILDSLSKFAVPIYMMISGALFLRESKSFSIKKLFRKNIFRLLVSYIFWTAVYFAYRPQEGVGRIFLVSYHLWFLPALIGIYILVPFLKIIAKDKGLLKYFVAFSTLIIVVMPMFMHIGFIRLFTETFLENINQGFSISIYVLYFVLGYYINTNEFKKVTKYVINSIGCISLVALPTITVIVSVRDGELYKGFTGANSVFVFFQTICIFMLFKNIFSGKKFSDKLTHILLEISKCTFGVYLIHNLIIYIVQDTGILTNLGISQVAQVLITICISFVVSLGISFLLNKIPVVKDYLV